MEPWLIKLLLIAVTSAFTAIFTIFVWVIKKVFSMLQSSWKAGRDDAAKNHEISLDILGELRAIRALGCPVGQQNPRARAETPPMGIVKNGK